MGNLWSGHGVGMPSHGGTTDPEEQVLLPGVPWVLVGSLPGQECQCRIVARVFQPRLSPASCQVALVL